MELASQKDITDEQKRRETDATNGEDTSETEITRDKAKNAICSCGQHTPFFLADSFPAYSAELFCKYGSAYSSLKGGKDLIAKNLGFDWAYSTTEK